NDPASLPAFESKAIKAWDWVASGIDIELEFSSGELNISSPLSIQDYRGARLLGQSHEVVIFDHGAGEVADFVTLRNEGNRTVVSLYHCKGAGGDKPGD